MKAAMVYLATLKGKGKGKCRSLPGKSQSSPAVMALEDIKKEEPSLGDRSKFRRLRKLTTAEAEAHELGDVGGEEPERKKPAGKPAAAKSKIHRKRSLEQEPEEPPAVDPPVAIKKKKSKSSLGAKPKKLVGTVGAAPLTRLRTKTSQDNFDTFSTPKNKVRKQHSPPPPPDSGSSAATSRTKLLGMNESYRYIEFH